MGAGAPERRGRLHHPRPEEAAQPLFQNSLEDAFLMEETAWVSCRSDGPLGKSRGIISKTQPRKTMFHRRRWSSGGWNSMRGQESLSPASCSRHTQLATAPISTCGRLRGRRRGVPPAEGLQGLLPVDLSARDVLSVRLPEGVLTPPALTMSSPVVWLWVFCLSAS